MSVIDEIKYRLKIMDITSRLGYRAVKNGKHFFISSIYKADKTPSLCLYPDTNMFKCYATDKGGDLIQFYQDACRIEKSQAIKELAEIAGITNDNIQFSKKAEPESSSGNIQKSYSEDITKDMTEDEKEIYFERLGIAGEKEALHSVKKYRLIKNTNVYTELYNYCLRQDLSKEAFDYLTVSRMLPLSSLIKFKVFFIRDYYSANNHMKKMFTLEQLQKSGLYNQKGNLIFFQHRIIISYLHNGQIVYLRGRYFDQQNNYKTDRNKYIGLGNDLLGLNGTKRFFNTDVLKTMLPGEKLYLVEGEFDAIALETIGFNTLCIPGAGNMPSVDKFKRLLDFNITVCGDNDEAGKGLIEKLTKVFEHYKKDFSIKELGQKDINDFLVVHNGK